MKHSPRTSRLRTGLRALSVASLAVLVAAVVMMASAPSTNQTSGNAPVSTPAPEARSGPTDASALPRELQPRLVAAMRSHQCASDVMIRPAQSWSALVVVGDDVRHVDADQGWAIYTGREPGRFVALCAGP